MKKLKYKFKNCSAEIAVVTTTKLRWHVSALIFLENFAALLMVLVTLIEMKNSVSYDFLRCGELRSS